MSMQSDQPKVRAGQNSNLRETYECLESIIFGISFMLLFFTLFARTVVVSGSSMLPTMLDGERLVLWQVSYDDPQYGDIVAIDRTQTDETVLIKRVIGMSGDIIDINFESGEVWRDGELLEESYINEPTQRSFDVEFPTEVPEGCIFVLGDNRNRSDDSRHSSIGMVDKREIMGKAVFRFWPLSQIGILDE